MSKLFILSLSCIIIFISCSKKEEFEHRTFYKLGTLIELTLPKKNKDVVNKIVQLINKEESEINSFTKKINTSKINTEVKINSQGYRLLKKAEYFYKLSDAHFDITLATITKQYGFPEGPFKIPADLNKYKKNTGFKYLKFTKNYVKKYKNLMIDTGAYSKGYIVDKAVDLVKKNNISNGIINAGGDLYALGTKNGKKWKIGIKNPTSSTDFLSIVNLSNSALATSGNYERFFIKNGKKIIHIFDGITKETANNYQSISVIAENVETADGLATVYFLMNLNDIKNNCKKLNTPVLVYDLKGHIHKLCHWEKYE
jgi:thiamine biosynthesis lipoprotein